MRQRARTTLAVLTTGLLLTACGGADGTSESTSTQTPSPTGAATGGETPDATTEAAPDAAGEGDAAGMRIVSLSPTATETLFAIDAGELVVAADSFSTHPPEAPAVEDLSAFSPNAEAIAEFEPDLVVLSNNQDDIRAQLDSLSIDTVLQPAVGTIDEAYEQMEELGELTDHEQEAADLVSSMQDEIASIVDGVDVPEGTTYYHELDDNLYSLTSSTFAGDVYGLFGMTSIADAAASEDDAGYPQLSAEYVIGEDPDMIFLADTDCCDVSAESVAQRAGWDQMTAVQEGHVVELGDDVPSRWGPRIVDFVQLVADGVRDLADA